MAYRFIQVNHKEFGVRWLLRQMGIYPNAYYNYLKNRKTSYSKRKKTACDAITGIYHEYGGILGYRSMRIFLARKNIYLSKVTVHKYMNRELLLFSIVKRKKPGYSKGKAHKVFDNLLKQNFISDSINKKWCTDFTYLFLADGSKRYNCSILDLHDRSVVASLNGKEITAELAINTLKKARTSQLPFDGKLILHSDQGSQFTSRAFIEYCDSQGITQSMSKAGCPFDNAPMERYYNTLKNELIYHRYYHSDMELNESVDNFAYVWYNHVRPHSYNGYKTPFEAINAH